MSTLPDGAMFLFNTLSTFWIRELVGINYEARPKHDTQLKTADSINFCRMLALLSKFDSMACVFLWISPCVCMVEQSVPLPVY